MGVSKGGQNVKYIRDRTEMFSRARARPRIRYQNMQMIRKKIDDVR